MPTCVQFSSEKGDKKQNGQKLLELYPLKGIISTICVALSSAVYPVYPFERESLSPLLVGSLGKAHKLSNLLATF